jgi:uncharacterized membrane protein YkvA (DUF1232 family)
MLENFRAVATISKQEIKVYQLVLKDKRTRKLAKFLLFPAVGYFLMPFDLILDFIPILGHINDLIIVPIQAILALKLIPKEVNADCGMAVIY